MASKTTGGVPKEVLRERETRVWALRMQGLTHDRIAAELELERSTVTKMLGRLSDRANDRMVDEISEEKRAQIEILRFMADEALQAWKKSKGARKNVTKRTSSGSRLIGKKPAEEMTIHSQDQDGDPRYLQTAMSALSEIRKILGMDAPLKQDVNTTGKVVFEVVRATVQNPTAHTAPQTGAVSREPG